MNRDDELVNVPRLHRLAAAMWQNKGTRDDWLEELEQVQGREGGEGPVWCFLPYGEDDVTPFYQAFPYEEGEACRWKSRRDLPRHLRLVYIAPSGDVVPL